ncbi:MAG: relaxase domain-containing protein [Acidimicrobiia bacterium]|nr:relaxase domain-containing protein [Acidimicrobiia bacterium]MDH3425419.1 relaxase domain-containing protein [Acidimicrobiia bacterium]
MSLAKAAKDYYLRKLEEISPGEDYYLRGGTATGIWRGSGAKDLGLEGAVSTEGLVRLFDGQHPGTGEQLGRSLRRDGVAAWDVTFSADKSVSLLWALGDPDTRQQGGGVRRGDRGGAGVFGVGGVINPRRHQNPGARRPR